jgi:hypothetical protein
MEKTEKKFSPPQIDGYYHYVINGILYSSELSERAKKVQEQTGTTLAQAMQTILRSDQITKFSNPPAPELTDDK